MKRQSVTLILDKGAVEMLTEFRRLRWKKGNDATLGNIAYAALYFSMLDMPRLCDIMDKAIDYWDAEGLDRNEALKATVASKVRTFRKFARQKKKQYDL